MKIEKIKNCITSQIKGEITNVGQWPSAVDPADSVPIYHVSSSQAFIQVIGYAKFLKGNGTVLYRDQCVNHDSLLLSGARPDAISVPNSTIDIMCQDDKIVNFSSVRDKYWCV